MEHSEADVLVPFIKKKKKKMFQSPQKNGLPKATLNKWQWKC